MPRDGKRVRGLRVKEFCVFAANYIWPQRAMVAEKLVLIIHLESDRNLPAIKNEIVRGTTG